MNLEKSLSLVSIKKPSQKNPVVKRREKLTRAINRQIEQIDRFRKGEKTSRQWFWNEEDGKLYVHIKYGKHILELGKGKFSIQCSSIDEVKKSLGTIVGEIKKGTFDDTLTQISENIRTNFGH